jgi:hypothetical protein
LAAPVHLPHGAVVNEFKVFFYDASEKDMTVALYRHYLNMGGYTRIAEVVSSGSDGYYSLVDNTISYPSIDNTQYSYHVYAYSLDWSSSLRIKGAVIKYTMP